MSSPSFNKNLLAKVFFLLLTLTISFSKNVNKGFDIVGMFNVQRNPQEITSDGVFSKTWLDSCDNPITVPGLASVDYFYLTGLDYDLQISNVYLDHDSTDDLGIRITLNKLSAKNFEIQVKSDTTEIGETLVSYELFLEIPTGEDVSIEWKKSYKIVNDYDPLEL